MLVVGAGPAGARAAAAASRKGVRVLLIERKSSPGTPVQCAEYVPRAVRGMAPLPREAVVQKTVEMVTFINQEPAAVMQAPGYLLNRAVFDRILVQQALEEGAELWTGRCVVARTGRGVVLRCCGSDREEEITCRVIIGADGPRSVVGSWMQSRNTDMLIGLQYLLPLSKPLHQTEIYFAPEYAGGYAWLFPKGDCANVGLGAYPSANCRLRPLLQELVQKLAGSGKVAATRPISQTGGLIPAGGPVAVTCYENMLLAGDAAGHTHPLTGAGIVNAMVCGELAGRVAARAVLEDNLAVLSDYPREWQGLLVGSLMRGLARRRELVSNWTGDPVKFSALVKKTWIGFVRQ